jgi:hypothetical protein
MGNWRDVIANPEISTGSLFIEMVKFIVDHACFSKYFIGVEIFGHHMATFMLSSPKVLLYWLVLQQLQHPSDHIKFRNGGL